MFCPPRTNKKKLKRDFEDIELDMEVDPLFGQSVDEKITKYRLPVKERKSTIKKIIGVFTKKKSLFISTNNRVFRLHSQVV